jgi:hypothetical protein
MLRLTSRITIKGTETWQFTALHSCKIVEDVASLTDTCELVLPKKISWQNAINTNGKPPIKRGDAIQVELGYDGKLETRFVGFIRYVDAKTPVNIKCEDGMFLLKQKKFEPKAFKNASLKEVITYLLQGSGIKFELIDPSIMLGHYRSQKNTVAQELQEIKERFMLNSYFRLNNGENVLYIGLTYPLDGRKKHQFIHGKNIISESFEYRDAAEIRAKVEAQSFDKKHQKIQLELGDKDGDVIKIRIDGLSKTELKKYAQQALDRYKQSGFKGSFESFGLPEVRKCDMVQLKASDGNQGTYLIKKNEIDFGQSGYRQKIELGQILNP